MAKKIKQYSDQKPYQIAPTPDVAHLLKVKGYNFDDEFDFQKFLNSYATTGFQASNISKGINICKEMQKNNSTIFLGYTSNMVTSGVRDIIRFLVQHKLVHALVTTGGGIEEDIIKVLKPFHIGVFNVSGRSLFEKRLAKKKILMNQFSIGHIRIIFQYFVLRLWMDLLVI